ncbi:MAG: hypothetical protein MJ252_22050, partial [archaeon]|nr:hypothetical protein [archaeon]
MLDNEKTLEQYFDKVSYICPDKNVYQIFIKDEKINKMNIAKFHVVSSEDNIYIFFNECFPIFKVNVGQKIKIKEYHLDITQNYLQLSIIKYNIKEKFMNYYTKKYYGI